MNKNLMNKNLIDLHMHSFFSDGVLLPAEIVQRARDIGFSAIAITDHIDFSNIDFVVDSIVKAADNLNTSDLIVIPGVEITHVIPEDIKRLAEKARTRGAKLIVVHGETIVEPVPKNTNRKALEANIDILAHPGLISEADVKLAKEKDICLEITTRKGHSLTNGHVAKLAQKLGAKLVINTDSHRPQDLGSLKKFIAVARGAGLEEEEVSSLFENSYNLVQKIIK